MRDSRTWLNLKGIVRQVGSRSTLVQADGQTWCLIGAEGLVDGAEAHLRGHTVGGDSSTKWLIVESKDSGGRGTKRAALLSQSDDDWKALQHAKREFRRVAVTIPSRVVESPSRSIPVTVTNLSFLGCQVEPELPMKIGSEIAVDLPPLSMVPARVSWTVRGKSGLEFLVPTDVRACVV